MAKSSFEVGEREKHSPTVDWDRVTKRVRIELDAEKLADEFHYWPGAKKFSFDIGSSKAHKVEVSVGMSSPLWVLVDGKPVRGSSD
jgi:hypothetical protein